MKNVAFFLLLITLFTNFFCQNQTSYLVKQPDPVVFVPKSHPMDVIEKGIDSVPEGNAIFFNWYDYSGDEEWTYRIYRANRADEEFEMINAIQDTFYLDEARNIQQDYYYYVTAINEDDEESESSDTLQYTLLWKTILSAPQGKITDVQPEFEWQDKNQPQYFILRLYRMQDDALIWLTRVELEFGTDYQKVNYNFNSTAILTELDRAYTYKWRVDAVGANQYSDSESQWMAFNY